METGFHLLYRLAMGRTVEEAVFMSRIRNALGSTAALGAPGEVRCTVGLIRPLPRASECTEQALCYVFVTAPILNFPWPQSGKGSFLSTSCRLVLMPNGLTAAGASGPGAGW